MAYSGAVSKGLVLLVGFLWFVQKGSACSNSYTSRRDTGWELRLSNPLRGVVARRNAGLPATEKSACVGVSMYSCLSLRGGSDDTAELHSYHESDSEAESQVSEAYH